MKLFGNIVIGSRHIKDQCSDCEEACEWPSVIFKGCAKRKALRAASRRDTGQVPDSAFPATWSGGEGGSPLSQNASEAFLLHELREYRREIEICERKIDDMRLTLDEWSALNFRIIECATTGIVITNERGIILSVNPAFERSTGYSAQEVIGRTPNVLKSGHQGEEIYRQMWESLKTQRQWQGEIWNRCKSGEIYPEWLSISAVTNHENKVTHYVGIFSDVHAQQHIMEELRYLAYYDELTGLPNRRLFLDRLDISLSHARRERQKLAVMFVDLDHFKNVNDALGHQAGDELLVTISERMKDCLREEDTLARLGGDEFTVILPLLHHEDAARNVAQKFLDSYKRPVVVNGEKVQVTASIGISVFSGADENADSLLNKADLAMYCTKERGRCGYMLYSTEMDSCPYPRNARD